MIIGFMNSLRNKMRLQPIQEVNSINQRTPLSQNNINGLSDCLYAFQIWQEIGNRSQKRKEGSYMINKVDTC